MFSMKEKSIGAFTHMKHITTETFTGKSRIQPVLAKYIFWLHDPTLPSLHLAVLLLPQSIN